MRTLTIIIICLFLTQPGFSQENDKPFSKMTYQELQAIDSGALSKADKRVFKKALRAAKKTDKKRIAAEKKAEKARAKAEAKRLKAEAKARKKYNKTINEHLSLLAETYGKTSVTKDDFEAYITIISPRYPTPFINIFNRREDTDYRMRAFFYPGEQKLSIQLQISNAIHTYQFTSETIGSLKGSPENIASRYGVWENYSRATIRGGSPLNLTPLSRYWSSCEASMCRFREDVGIDLSYSLIENSTRNLKDLQIKIAGRRYHFFVSIPSAFIAGFLKKMSEYVDINEQYTEIANQVENGLKEELAVGPDIGRK